MGFISSFKKAYNEDLPGEHYEVAGSNIACPYCGGDLFEKSAVQIREAELASDELDWVDGTAYALVCSTCGHLELFLKEPKKF